MNDDTVKHDDLSYRDSVQQGRRNAFLFAGAAGLAGLMFGLDTGVIAGALKFMGLDLGANERAQEWIVSSLMLGAAGGSLLAIPVSHYRGGGGPCSMPACCSCLAPPCVRWPRPFPS